MAKAKTKVKKLKNGIRKPKKQLDSATTSMQGLLKFFNFINFFNRKTLVKYGDDVVSDKAL